MGDTGELIHVGRVVTKSKQTKLNVYTPPNPIKITHEHDCSHTSDSNNSSDSESFSKSDELSNSNEFSECEEFSEKKTFSEQQHNTPRENDASPGVTAVAAVMMAEPIKGHCSKKVPTKKLFESY